MCRCYANKRARERGEKSRTLYKAARLYRVRTLTCTSIPGIYVEVPLRTRPHRHQPPQVPRLRSSPQKTLKKGVVDGKFLLQSRQLVNLHSVKIGRPCFVSSNQQIVVWPSLAVENLLRKSDGCLQIESGVRPCKRYKYSMSCFLHALHGMQSVLDDSS